MKIATVREILSRLNSCIDMRVPFSHIRFGDGGIKFLHSVLFRDVEQLNVIIQKEGIPFEKVLDIFNMWGYYARNADYIDSPNVYFTKVFWPRVKKKGKSIRYQTVEKLRKWEHLYLRADFLNTSYCNPESNYLMLIESLPLNLFDVMKNRKICIITARPEIREFLNSYGYNIDVVPIVGQWQDHYNKCFHYVMDVITNRSKEYDFWLVSAGEIGRIYSGRIKECGGRCIDIGFVVDFWLDGSIHPRFGEYLVPSFSNRLTLSLTIKGRFFRDWI